MVIDISANGSVTTMLVYLNWTLKIYVKDFGFDLVCLPFSQLNVILGINLVNFNHIYINCFNKSVLFPKFDEEEKLRFRYTNQVEDFLKGDA